LGFAVGFPAVFVGYLVAVRIDALTDHDAEEIVANDGAIGLYFNVWGARWGVFGYAVAVDADHHLTAWRAVGKNFVVAASVRVEAAVCGAWVDIVAIDELTFATDAIGADARSGTRVGCGAAGAVFSRVKDACMALVSRNTPAYGAGVLVFTHDDLIGHAGTYLAYASDGTGIGCRTGGAIVDGFEDALKELLVPVVGGADVQIIACGNADGLEIILAARSGGEDNESKD